MSGKNTARMIGAYYQEAEPTSFFAGMFRARPENFHNSEEVEIDIVRSDEEVSIVVQDLSTGYRMNSEDLYTNKGFKPPIHKEAVVVNSHDLIKRMPGQNPFEDPAFRANLIMRVFNVMRKTERKIRRAMELQASQVMQTGKVTLTDASGTAVYELDYKPKASHFPTVGTSWATAALAGKLGDIKSLCDVVRGDGLMKPDRIIFGDAAWENLLQTDGFLDRFDARRANLGEINAMRNLGEGGIYHGVMEVGNYSLEVWTYDGRYKDPQTGNSTQFMDSGKFIVQAANGRLDASFGAIPNIGALLGIGQRILPELPSRMSGRSQGMDLSTNAWLSADNETIYAGVGSRPLMIPVAIDTFGCADTQL